MFSRTPLKRILTKTAFFKPAMSSKAQLMALQGIMRQNRMTMFPQRTYFAFEKVKNDISTSTGTRTHHITLSNGKIISLTDSFSKKNLFSLAKFPDFDGKFYQKTADALSEQGGEALGLKSFTEEIFFLHNILQILQVKLSLKHPMNSQLIEAHYKLLDYVTSLDFLEKVYSCKMANEVNRYFSVTENLNIFETFLYRRKKSQMRERQLNEIDNSYIRLLEAHQKNKGGLRRGLRGVRAFFEGSRGNFDGV